MNLSYASVCSGIEVASVAWKPLGWTPKFFAEIEKFPSAVLARHYGSNMPDDLEAALERQAAGGFNGVLNYGDFTAIGADAGPVDLLVGGTPCQSFSVAGKRLGLDDPRGNLALEYLRLARRLRARWIVWENVPGVLSSFSGSEQAERQVLEGDVGGEADGFEERDFAMFLSFVRECGYGFAYRVLDTQFVRVSGYERAIPQRRRRVILVGHLGDWRRAAAVLFDPGSMRGHPPPRREAGQGVAGTLDAGPGVRGDPQADRGHLIAESDVADTVSLKWSKGAGGLAGDECQNIVAFSAKDYGGDASENVSPTLRSGGHANSHANAGVMPAIAVPDVAHTLKAEGADASEDGTGRGAPLVPAAWNARQDEYDPKPVSPPLDTDRSTVAVAYDLRGREDGAQFEGPHDTANIRAHFGGSSRSYVLQSTASEPAFPAKLKGGRANAWTVRRLTPTECERLQGVPDGYTQAPDWDGWRDVGPDEDMDDLRDAGFRLRQGKRGWRVNDPDGPRYKALGNSFSANVFRHIGERIDLFERLVAEGKIPPRPFGEGD